jgi:signal transduction histidine kinase
LNLRHGLGVLLVRQIVEAHHGTVEIESTPQNGYQTVLVFPGGGP